MAPAEVPTTLRIRRPASWRACRAPMKAKPLAPPPSKTTSTTVSPGASAAASAGPGVSASAAKRRSSTAGSYHGV